MAAVSHRFNFFLNQCVESFNIFIAILTEKRSFGRLRRSWEDNIRMDPKEIDISTRNWVDSAQERDNWRALVNAGLNFQVP